MTKIAGWKIRTKLTALILIMGAASVGLFVFLWEIQGDVARLLEHTGIIDWFDEDEFLKDFTEQAEKYDVPESEKDKDGVRKIQPLLEQFVDDYTGISIYGKEDGLYKCGKTPEILNKFIYGSVLSSSQVILGEQYKMVDVEFANGTYQVVYSSYNRSRFTYPYLTAIIVLCITVFLGGILIFMGRVMKRIHRVKESIVRMSQGDLKCPVEDCGSDEVGIVAKELDILRKTLDENIRKEIQSREANKDLITAMSHDLRTPLTVLTGYLEVLKLKRGESDMREEYVERCLKKTEDIRMLTDRMFEYALVYEVQESVKLMEISVSVLTGYLEENCDFIRLVGFSVSPDINCPEGTVLGDEMLMKRIFSNLFSNILKYGDKSTPVSVRAETDQGRIKITLVNRVKENVLGTESNRIGLRSAERMVHLSEGELYVFEQENFFSVQAVFKLMHTGNYQKI